MLIILMACTKDSEEKKAIAQSMNFYGCDNHKMGSLKSSIGECVVKYEILSDNRLKVIRSEKLNCSTDSVSVKVQGYDNSLSITEVKHIDGVAFCDCNMSYDYIIGPLKLKEYKITIVTPNNGSYTFNLTLENLTSGDICN